MAKLKLMTGNLKESVITSIALHTPFSISELSDAYERLNSVDSLLLACDLADNVGRPLYEAVNNILAAKNFTAVDDTRSAV